LRNEAKPFPNAADVVELFGLFKHRLAQLISRGEMPGTDAYATPRELILSSSMKELLCSKKKIVDLSINNSNILTLLIIC